MGGEGRAGADRRLDEELGHNAGLKARRADLQTRFFAKLSSRTAHRGGERDAEGGDLTLEGVARSLAQCRKLSQIEASLGYRLDILRMMDDLRSSVTEVRRAREASDRRETLQGLRASTETYGVLCSACEQQMKLQHLIRADHCSDAVRNADFLDDLCRQIRAEFWTLISLILSHCEGWPPKVVLADGAGKASQAVLAAFSKKCPELFSDLTTSVHWLCVLQKHAQGARRWTGAAPQGNEERLWLTRPLFEEFVARACFHFGETEATFRVDKPEWLLKYGLASVETFRPEARAIATVLKGTGLEDAYSVREEFAYAIGDLMRKLLPQYLLVGNADGDSLLLHVAKEVNAFDLKFAAGLHPMPSKALGDDNPFSPTAAWGYGYLIDTFAGNECMVDWLQAERTFAKECAERFFQMPEAWEEEPLSAMLKPFHAGSQVGSIPKCVHKLCRLLIEYINFSRSFREEGIRTEFLDAVGDVILRAFLKKADWRANSYNAYGESFKGQAVDAVLMCLSSVALVEEILDACMHCPQTARVKIFERYAKEAEYQSKTWAVKVSKILYKDTERAVHTLGRALERAEADSPPAFDEEGMEFSNTLDAVGFELEGIKARLPSDVFRFIWTAVAASLNAAMAQELGPLANTGGTQARVYRDCSAKIIDLFKGFTVRPKAYFKAMLCALDA